MIPKRDPTHRHKCKDIHCGYVWEHGEHCAGDQKAHECPKCGKEQYQRFFGDRELKDMVKEW